MLEAVRTGVPMVLWPSNGDQMANTAFLVEKIRDPLTVAELGDGLVDW